MDSRCSTRSRSNLPSRTGRDSWRRIGIHAVFCKGEGESRDDQPAANEVMGDELGDVVVFLWEDIVDRLEIFYVDNRSGSSYRLAPPANGGIERPLLIVTSSLSVVAAICCASGQCNRALSSPYCADSNRSRAPVRTALGLNTRGAGTHGWGGKHERRHTIRTTFIVVADRFAVRLAIWLCRIWILSGCCSNPQIYGLWLCIRHRPRSTRPYTPINGSREIIIARLGATAPICHRSEYHSRRLRSSSVSPPSSSSATRC